MQLHKKKYTRLLCSTSVVVCSGFHLMSAKAGVAFWTTVRCSRFCLKCSSPTFHQLSKYILNSSAGADMKLRDVNERCRFLYYLAGQYFEPHTDGRYPRPREHPHCGDVSQLTLQLYLNDVSLRVGRPPSWKTGERGKCLASWKCTDLLTELAARRVLAASRGEVHNAYGVHVHPFTAGQQSTARRPPLDS